MPVPPLAEPRRTARAGGTQRGDGPEAIAAYEHDRRRLLLLLLGLLLH